MKFPVITRREAANLINNGDNVGFSGFTPPGAPKEVPEAIAERAIEEHEAGRPFKINLYTGASTSDRADGVLARANAINRRAPYQNIPDLRKRINAHDTHYCDLHLSEMAQKVRYGFFGEIDTAIIEVADIKDNGELVLGMGVGNIPTYAKLAKKIIIEKNEKLPAGLNGVHDIYMPLDPPYRREIPIYKPSDRIGSTTLQVDPRKIVGVVHSDDYDNAKSFTAPDETTARIGHNVCEFLENEVKQGRIPKTFLPIQSGVGNVANAVLFGLADSTIIPAFEMYTEVIQDSVIELMKQGKCRFGSTCALTLSNKTEEEFFNNIDFFRDKVIIRPAEISNSPEIARRLGVISMNTAIEADIFGNVNSTHITGIKMMNGIGGSGDFTRNGYISIFSCPSITKEGKISNIVPMVSHVDHSEHSVDIIITDQGVADLRGKDPVERAHEIIDHAAHPMYRDLLREYLKIGRPGQTPHRLEAALAFHNEFNRSGDMRNVDYAQYL